MADTRTDLAAKVDAAWSAFTGALAEAIGQLPEGSDLELVLDPTATGTGEAVYDVQISRLKGEELHADATSNATLPDGVNLDRTTIAHLVTLGWQPPGVVEGAGERFGLRLPLSESQDLAEIITRTFRDMYNAPHPAFLTYDFTGDTEAPTLATARLAPSIPASTEPRAITSEASGLGSVVREVVAAMQRTEPDRLSVDDNGEISLRAGSAMVFIKSTDRPAVVDVYSPLLTEVDPNERLYRELSELTQRLPIGRLYYLSGTIWVSVPVYGRDFQPTHLMLAVESMTRLADDLDDRLQGKFGGRRFFEPATDAPEDEPRTGMYL
ncbi:hypothetical protein AB0I28_05585 [Phytomonospora sp. NPDC050363]|uniref:T3SS (YopN, CesT) and YbjN peptide-binding chaperone 1 n=1 Tax=Phytomonospora sp. NPDC050363 TaxID=3155642 RepID=UPI0033DDF36F